MTRARHVTPCHTAARLERMRTLISTLQAGRLTREQIGDLLKIGPSGVRKYLVDLQGKVALEQADGRHFCRLTMSEQETAAYLAKLAIDAARRPAAGRPSDFEKASRDPSRHFHILADDEHYAIRLRRNPIVRDPLVAAFFGPHGVSMETRA